MRIARRLLSLVIAIIVVVVTFNAVTADYVGPAANRSITEQVWKRRYCLIHWYVIPEEHLYALPRYLAPTSSCPSGVIHVAGTQLSDPDTPYWACITWSDWNYSGGWDDRIGCTPTDRFANYRKGYWISDTTIHFQDISELQDCSSGQAGCAQIAETVHYENATVSGTPTCANPGNNGWCKSDAVLQITGYEPIPTKEISNIETLSGVLCAGDYCDYTVTADGSTSVTYWANSTYGDSSTQSTTVLKVDQTPPTATIDVEGTHHTVTIHGLVEDTTSGIESAEISLDGGVNWSAVTLAVDGTYSQPFDTTPFTAGTVIDLQIHAVDNAGNETLNHHTISIDSDPPVVVLNTQNTYGNILVMGEIADAASGARTLEFSSDNGANWEVVSTDSTGHWSGEIDSTLYPDGTTLELALRGTDIAGNIAVTNASVTVSNAETSIFLQNSWQLPASGTLSIVPGCADTDYVLVTICDTNGKLGCIETTYDGQHIPSAIEWDGKINGEEVPTGDYPISVLVTDLIGRTKTASATISVIKEEPSFLSYFELPEAPDTPEPEQEAVITGVIPADVETVEEPKENFFNRTVFKMAPGAILLGLAGVMGASTVVDPRIAQWKALDKSLTELSENLSKTNEQ